MSALFLTGATGFLGMEVLARVLERSGREIIALVRAADAAAAKRRIERTLWHLFGTAGARFAPRVEALRGDLTAPRLGLEADRWEALAAKTFEVVHCGASVSFATGLPQARAINVGGTRRVLELAHDAARRGSGLRRLVHVSTAYVGGTYPGRFGEEDLEVGQRFRNAYERSKLEAELALHEARGDLPAAIARPSIVVGEQDTGWTSSFNVLYWPLRAFARGLYELVPARPDATLDVVPVDYAADAITALLDAPAEGIEPGCAYHLTAGESAATVAELVDLASSRFGREPPEVVAPEEFEQALARRELNPLRAAALEQSAPYLPYLSVEGEFDSRRARALLEPAGLDAPPIGDYFERLMAFADAAKWGKRTLGRPEARSLAAGVPRAREPLGQAAG